MFSPAILGFSYRERLDVKSSFSFIGGASSYRCTESYSRAQATHTKKSAWATQIQPESIYTTLTESSPHRELKHPQKNSSARRKCKL